MIAFSPPRLGAGLRTGAATMGTPLSPTLNVTASVARFQRLPGRQLHLHAYAAAHHPARSRPLSNVAFAY
eukprot:1122822-Prymnesium_polylepis.1